MGVGGGGWPGVPPGVSMRVSLLWLGRCCGSYAGAPYLHLLCRLLVLGGADVVLGVGSGATGE